jgi:putative hemolysin
MASFSPMNSMRIDVRALLESYAPSFWKGLPASLRPLMVRIFRKILCVTRIEDFYEKHRGIRGFNLIDDILDVLDKTYLVTARELEHIPASGHVVCVSNHPLGGLDALMILRVIGEIRSDVRIVVNDALLALDGFTDLFLPVDVFSGKNNRTNVKAIHAALDKNQAVIFFPAAEVSRISLRGITDTKWHTGAVRFAQRHHAPLLPIRIDARNTILFYAMSLMMKSFSTLLLPREVFQSRCAPVRLRIGEIVPYEAFAQLQPKAATKLIRKQSEALILERRGRLKQSAVLPDRRSGTFCDAN